MTDGDTSGDAGKTEAVRENADHVSGDRPTRADLYQGTYTNRWKDLCRDLLSDYAKFSLDANNGSPLGATTIRKHIIAKLRDNKMSLTVNNIFDFLHKRTYPDDTTFSYIDQFLRCIQFDDPSYKLAKEKIRIEIDARIRSSLSRFYSYRTNDDDAPQRYIDVFLDRTYVSKPMSDSNLRMPRSGVGNDLKFRQVAIRFNDFKNGMFAAKAIYSNRSLWNLKQSKSISRTGVGIYHGYLIPQYDGAVSSDVIYGTIHLRKQGAEGIGAVYPNTVSSFSYHDDYGARLVTDWAPQLLLPLKHNAQTSEMGLAPSNVELNLEKNDRYDTQSYISKGIMTMTPLPSDFGFVDDFIESLTNEYLLW